jgi:Na+-transporting methylmalonyl-CoA/oxaloacetate decarboxylase gamma subunit
MKKSTLRLIGGVQAIIFCAGMYLVVLFLSILVCSSVYRALELNRAEVQLNPESTLPANPVLVSR